MNNTTRRAVRVGTALAIALSFVGIQGTLSPATASTATTTWMPSSAPALWSDHDCATDNSAPSYTPASAPSDSAGLGGTQTYVADAGSDATGPSDVAWSYAPASGTQAGPMVTIPSTTTGMSIDVRGATGGRLMVIYNTTSNNQPVNYVGVWDFTTVAGWQTVTAGDLTWYQWQPASLVAPGQWVPANLQFFKNVPVSLGGFFKGRSGTAQAAFELGCTGSFAFDHLRVTDTSANVVDYDAQTPTTTTVLAQGAPSVAYGGTTTITPLTTTWDENNVATGANPAGVETLLGSTDGGATWTTVATTAPGSAFTVQPSQTTTYKVQYASTTDLDPQPSTSDPVSVAVVPKATIGASAARVNVNKLDTFTVRVTPAATSVPVTFQQLSGTSWVSIGSASTDSTGVATLARARSSAGAWRVRAIVAAHPGYLATTTSSVTVGVYQPVSLTIARSASVVRVGSYFRIYGVVTPHSSGIGLQFQQYLSGRWVTIATGRSGTRGVYSFTKLARTAGTATFRVVAPALGYRLRGTSAVTRVAIYVPYTPPPPPPPTGGGGGGSGIG